jgi:uncharacterized protein
MEIIGDTLPSAAEKEQRNWGMFCHLAALAVFVPIIPFGNIVGPLVIWLWKRHEIPGVNEHGKAALNFHLSITIYLLAIGLLVALPLLFCSLLFPLILIIAIPIWIALAIGASVMVIAEVILTIVAGLQASDGKHYRYPLTLDLIR